MIDLEILRIFVLVFMFIFGAVLGSFACCQAYRWRQKAHKKKNLGRWSVCMSCKKRIKWYDNIPILSWLILRGKCRYCRKKIGATEVVSEILTGLAFLAIGWAYVWPLISQWSILAAQRPVELGIRIAILLVTLILFVVLVILAVYDAKWGELPTILLMIAIVLGTAICVLNIYQASLISHEKMIEMIFSTLAGVGILAGVCFLIYKISRERMMGGGDYLLALALALALSNWWLSLWVMFLANLIGNIVALPNALKKGKNIIYFGPFLVIAYTIVFILGNCLPHLLGGVL